MLSYVCISGVNVSAEDARALGDLIGDTPVRLDLIDVTDSTGRFHPPDDGECRSFRDALTRYIGQPVVRRYSGGKEIRAACGTLAGGGLMPWPREPSVRDGRPRSDLPRMGAALELEAEGPQEFEDRPAIGPQRRLVLGPGLRVR